MSRFLRQKISIFLAIVLVFSSAWYDDNKIYGAQDLLWDYVTVIYSDTEVDYDEDIHYPDFSVETAPGGPEVQVEYEYTDENSYETVQDSVLPGFVEVGVHTVHVCVNAEIDGVQQDWDKTVTLTINDPETPGESEESEESEVSEEPEEPGEQSDVVAYVKQQYQYAITHTENSVGEYKIKIKDAGYTLVYDKTPGSTWKQLDDYFSSDIFSDYSTVRTKMFRHPFRYFVTRVAPVKKKKTVEEVTEIKIDFDTSMDLDANVISDNLAAMQVRYDAIMRDAKSAGGLTDAEKVLLVHNAMARELDADYDNRIQDDGAGTTHWGLLRDGIGSSAGYAYLFKACMNDLGIQCDVVYSTSKYNYWNMVVVDGSWYHVDVMLDDLVTSDEPYTEVYDNVLEETTMYDDICEDNSNDGYVSYRYYLRTDEEIKNLGYSEWVRIGEMGSISKGVDVAEGSQGNGLTGIFSDVVGNMAYLNGYWYVADSSDVTNKIIKQDYYGHEKSVIATDYPVMYIQSDGTYLYYSSGDKIIRMNGEGAAKRTGVEVQDGQRITEFAVKLGKLVYTIADDSGTEVNTVGTGDIQWILEGCEHEWVDNVTPPTCTEEGYTTKVCSICDFTYLDEDSYVEPTGHSGGTPTCITLAICEVCGTEYGDIDPENHVGEEIIKNHKASTCCEKGYSGDAYCSVCKHLMHKGTELELDPDNHTGNTEIRDDAEPTCTAMGYTGDTYCVDCDTLLESGSNIAMIPHTGGVANCISPAICEICSQQYGFINPNNHVNSEVQNKVEPDCLTPGYTGDHYCSDCDTVYMVGDIIPALGHDYVGEVTEPTCTEQGYTTYTCSRCDDSYVDDQSYTEPLGHSGGSATCSAKAVCERCGEEYGEISPYKHVNLELQNFVQATCEEDGYSGDFFCLDCQQVAEIGGTIPAVGHDDVPDTIPPTCTEDGYTNQVCSRCGRIELDENSTVPATGHVGGTATCSSKPRCEVCGVKYGMADPDNHNYLPTVYEATCLVEGYVQYTCEYCGDSYISDTTEKAPHKGGKATCVAKAVCDVCHEEYGEINPNVHANLEVKETVEPTCSSLGYTGNTYCADCGMQTATGTDIAMTSHDYEKVATPSTCTAKGYSTYTCKNCGHQKVENYTAALGHNYVTTTKPAVTGDKTQGTIVVACSRCGLVKSTTTVNYAKTATLGTTTYTYNGSKKKPSVSVTDSTGQLIPSSNYTVAYSNNLNVGQGKVVITMKGKYSGTFTKTFMIKPKPTSVTSVAGLTKGIRINWKKQTTQVTGYEIQYSTSSSFAAASTKKVTLTKGFDTKKVTGLTAKKKYYVRIRTYTSVKIDGVTTKVYSSWSTTKNAKAK